MQQRGRGPRGIPVLGLVPSGCPPTAPRDEIEAAPPLRQGRRTARRAAGASAGRRAGPSSTPSAPPCPERRLAPAGAALAPRCRHDEPGSRESVGIIHESRSIQYMSLSNTASRFDPVARARRAPHTPPRPCPFALFINPFGCPAALRRAANCTHMPCLAQHKHVARSALRGGSLGAA